MVVTSKFTYKSPLSSEKLNLPLSEIDSNFLETETAFSILLTNLEALAARVSELEEQGFSGDSIPVGAILPYGAGGNTPPEGFLICDGSLLATTGTYEALFAIIGYLYGGSGDVFALPNLRGRVAVACGQGNGLTYRLPGNVGGEELHTLLLTEIPSHTHTYVVDIFAPYGAGGTGGCRSSVTSGNTGTAGGGVAHNNMPPFLVTGNFIIKF